MKPAFSVVFLTTLIGAGQGLFLALFACQLFADPSSGLLVEGGIVSLILCALGLFASFFHLGHPERAWRAAAMWRTSWLSREVIVLPMFMAAVFAWTVARFFGVQTATPWFGAIATLLAIALFVCTGMIYASIRFLLEWASPLTLVNYTLLGCASGTTLAAAFAAFQQPDLARALAFAAIALTLTGLAFRLASLWRNDRIRPKSTLQSAIGVRHPRIVQITQGFMGLAFNTKEFFHGRTREALQTIRLGFLVAAFAVPVLALVWVLAAGPADAAWLALAAFAIQYLGLLAERWYFFAQARHPQNLYYQAMA